MGRSYSQNGGDPQVFQGAEQLETLLCPPLPANTNNYQVKGNAFLNASLLLISATAPINLSGLVGGTPNRQVTLMNIGASVITLLDSSGLSAAANRFILGSADALSQWQSVSFIWNAVANAWIPAGGGSGGGGGGAPATATYWTQTDETLILPNSKVLSTGDLILPRVFGGDQVVTPPSAGWTLDLNGAAASVATGPSGEIILTTGAGNPVYRRAYAGGDFDFRLYVTNPKNQGYALMVRDSSTGNLITAGSTGNDNTTPGVLTFTSPPGAVAGPIAFGSAIGNFTPGTAPISFTYPYGWVRITKVGTVYDFFVSLDGDVWLANGTETTGFAAAPDQVGLLFLAGATNEYKFWSMAGI